MSDKQRTTYTVVENGRLIHHGFSYLLARDCMDSAMGFKLGKKSSDPTYAYDIALYADGVRKARFAIRRQQQPSNPSHTQKISG